MAIKLYDLAGAEDDRRFSPYCWRVKMALKHKGLDFETIPWRFTDEEAIAPYKSTTVPVLLDGNESVADSWAIALYLDEVYPSRPRLFSGTESRTLWLEPGGMQEARENYKRAYFGSLLKVSERLAARWGRAADAGTAIDLQGDLMRYTVDTVAGLAWRQRYGV